MNTEQPAEVLVPNEVRPLAGYRMWIRFADGVEDEADLSHLEGSGVFKAWEDEVDLNSDTLYIYMTGKTWEELYPPETPEVVLENAEARRGHAIWVRFDDGTEGEIGISSYLAVSSWELEREKRLFEEKIAIVSRGMLV